MNVYVYVLMHMLQNINPNHGIELKESSKTCYQSDFGHKKKHKLT